MRSSNQVQVSLDNAASLVTRNWGVFLTAIIAFVAAAVLAAFLMTPMYRASTVVFPVSDEEGLGGLGRMMSQVSSLTGFPGIQMGGGSARYQYVEYLRSKAFLAGFIEDKNLLPELFSEKWNAADKSWVGVGEGEQPSLWDGVRLLQDNVLNVSEDIDTGAVRLSITWNQPETSASWANELVSRANRDLRAKAIEEAEASIGFLNTELSRTDVVELRQAIYGLIEAQVKVQMLASVRDEYAFRIIDPAMAPDMEDFVAPKRLVMILLAAVVGFVVALVIALLRQSS